MTAAEMEMMEGNGEIVAIWSFCDAGWKDSILSRFNQSESWICSPLGPASTTRPGLFLKFSLRLFFTRCRRNYPNLRSVYYLKRGPYSSLGHSTAPPSPFIARHCRLFLPPPFIPRTSVLVYSISRDEATTMGFFVGFFSGFALTTSVLYLTIQVHRANRLEQSSIIREQIRALNWIASPIGAYDRRLAPKDQPPLDPDRPRLSQPALKDFLKHRWNQEVETLVRKAYESRWEDARDTAVVGWKAAMRLVKRE